MSDSSEDRPLGASDFTKRYDHWRELYSRAGKPGPQEAVWEGSRLLLREGYPYEGWGGYIIEPRGSEYAVLDVTTERRVEPLESPLGYFSLFELAGKYIIWNIGENLRVRSRIPSLELTWGPASLSPGVRAIPIAKYETRYELIDAPQKYIVIRSGGIQPENRLLTMSYDDLDRALEEGLPVAITGE